MWESRRGRSSSTSARWRCGRPCREINHPDTAACRNQLAVAYRLAGRTDRGQPPVRPQPQFTRPRLRAGRPRIDAAPREETRRGRAETARVPDHPPEDPARRLDDRSTPSRLLGEALLEQKKYAEAEPLLLSGYEGMKQREDAIPPQDKPRLTRALERLVKLYEAWGKTGEGDEVAEGTGAGEGHEEILTIPRRPCPRPSRCRAPRRNTPIPFAPAKSLSSGPPFPVDKSRGPAMSERPTPRSASRFPGCS